MLYPFLPPSPLCLIFKCMREVVSEGLSHKAAGVFEYKSLCTLCSETGAPPHPAGCLETSDQVAISATELCMKGLKEALSVPFLRVILFSSYSLVHYDFISSIIIQNKLLRA